ncbi:hypothetical protein H2248_008043 [Termitomyces sp. 'cryptogamus']|nr:hypothetical protein H2248_008043 [Termitomyces sp. 'cryptogamus']
MAFPMAASNYLPGNTSFSQHVSNIIIHILIGKWSVAQIWLECIPPIMNDFFIVWRAWVIFERRRWALYVLIGLCLSTLVLTFVLLLMFQKSSNYHGDMIIPLSIFELTIPVASIVLQQLGTTSLSAVTNFVATFFIGWTLW